MLREERLHSNLDQMPLVQAEFFPNSWIDSRIQELLEVFGPLQKLIVPRDSTNASIGIAVFEYADPDITDTAVEGLHGLRLGDMELSAYQIKSWFKSTAKDPATQVLGFLDQSCLNPAGMVLSKCTCKSTVPL